MLLGNDLCPSVPAVDVAVVTRSQTAALRREADLQTPLVSDSERNLTEAESDSVDKPAETDLASLFESSDVTDTIPLELVDRTELIRLQQSDLSLASLFELAEKHRRKSRGGHGGRVPPENWTAGDGNALCPPQI